MATAPVQNWSPEALADLKAKVDANPTTTNMRTYNTVSWSNAYNVSMPKTEFIETPNAPWINWWWGLTTKQTWYSRVVWEPDPYLSKTPSTWSNIAWNIPQTPLQPIPTPPVEKAPPTLKTAPRQQTDYTQQMLDTTTRVSESAKAWELASIENQNNLLQNIVKDAKRVLARQQWYLTSSSEQAKKEQQDLLAQKTWDLTYQQQQQKNIFEDTKKALTSSKDISTRTAELSSALAWATYEWAKRQVQNIVDTYQGQLSQTTRDYLLSDSYIAKQKTDLSTNALNNIVKIDIETMNAMQQAQNDYQKQIDTVTEGKRYNAQLTQLINEKYWATLQKSLVDIMSQAEDKKQAIYESDRAYWMDVYKTKLAQYNEEKKFDYQKYQDTISNNFQERNLLLWENKFQYEKDWNQTQQDYKAKQDEIDNQYKQDTLDYTKSRDKIEDERWQKTYNLQVADNKRQQKLLDKQIANIDNEIASRKDALSKAKTDQDIADINLKIKQLDLAKTQAEADKASKWQDADTLKKNFDQESTLRKDFNSDKQVQNHLELSRQVWIAKSAIDQMLADPWNPAYWTSIDQALLVTFQKILDPTSVVKEAEYDRGTKGQAWFDQLKWGIEKIMQGWQGLTNENRLAIYDMMKKFQKWWEEPFLQKVSQYTWIAKSYWLDPEKIVWDFSYVWWDSNDFFNSPEWQKYLTTVDPNEALNYLKNPTK